MEASSAYVRPGLDLAAPPLPHATAASSPPQQAVGTGNFSRRTAPATNNSGGAPPMLNRSRSKQTNNANMENSAVASVDSNMDTVVGSFDQRFATLKSIGEDRVNDLELKLLLKKKPAPICYVWCDPSPWMHISQGIMKTLSINKMVKSGFKVKILMADWFAQMNSEIGGNLNKMRTIGRYNIEMWKATGMALDEVELVWLSDEISRHGDEYWPLVMDIARKNSVRRIRRYCGSRDPYTMGQLTVAEMFYPCLQSAGILFQKICFLIYYNTLQGRIGGIQHGLSSWKMTRTFLSMEELTTDYESGALHPADLKLALVKSLNKLLQPVHNHFGSTEAKDLVKAIKEYYVAD